MKRVKRFFNLVPAMLMWLVLSVLIWGFVFTRITDAPAAEKITLFVDAPVPHAVEMATEMEKTAYEGIRMVKVHPFTYAMMSADAIATADLYILPQSHIETYLEHFVPLPEEMHTPYALTKDGTAYGLQVLNGETGEGCGNAYITYLYPGMENQSYYLFFGKNSVHVPGNDGAVDNAALSYARSILAMK